MFLIFLTGGRAVKKKLPIYLIKLKHDIRFCDMRFCGIHADIIERKFYGTPSLC